MTEFLTQKGCHAKIKVFTQMCSVHRSIFLKRFELFLLQMKSSIFLIVLWTVMQWNTAHAYFCCNCNAKIVSATYNQPRPQGPDFSFKMADRRNPWPRLLKYTKNRGVFCHQTHDGFLQPKTFVQTKRRHFIVFT